jgi:hypothetical protein
MSTAAQVTANQKNAQASTGPRTTEGKAASSRNALKFGLTSKQILLPWENPADFEALHAAIAEQFQPASDAESMLVDNIAIAEWRERRTEIAQTAWLAVQTKDAADSHKASATAMFLSYHEVEKFQKYAASYRRERYRAWSKLEAMQKARRAEAQRQQEEARRDAEARLKAVSPREAPGRAATRAAGNVGFVLASERVAPPVPSATPRAATSASAQSPGIRE